MAAAVPLTEEQIRYYRLAVHHLDHRYPAAHLQEAAGVCGLQNSPPGAWQTAMFARLTCTLTELQTALEQEKTLLQAWSYRGAPVVFPTAESPRFLSAMEAYPGEEPWIYTRGITLALDYLGMDWAEAFARVEEACTYLENHTIQSKEELDRVLARQVALRLSPALRQRWEAPSTYGRPDRQTVGGAVVSFALRPCSFRGRVVFGTRQGIHPTFTAYTRWVGGPVPGDPAVGEKMVRQFLHAYGPATRAELTEWLGCSPAQAKRLWSLVEKDLVPVCKQGKRAYMQEADLAAVGNARPPACPLVLLGPHDPYLDARDRSLLVADPIRQRKVWQTVANPGVLLRNGQVAGMWKTSVHGDRLDATLTPFAPLDASAVEWVQEQTADYALFKGLSPGHFTLTEP